MLYQQILAFFYRCNNNVHRSGTKEEEEGEKRDDTLHAPNLLLNCPEKGHSTEDIMHTKIHRSVRNIIFFQWRNPCVYYPFGSEPGSSDEKRQRKNSNVSIEVHAAYAWQQFPSMNVLLLMKPCVLT